MTREQLAILAGVLVIAVFVLMWLGYRARARRQSDYPEPLPVPAERDGAAMLSVAVAYVATTAGGDPIDRLAVHGLGMRGNGRIDLHPDGVSVIRDGARDFFIPAVDIADAEPASVAIDRGVEKDGLIAINWALGGSLVSTVVRTKRAADRGALRDAVNELGAQHDVAGGSSAGENAAGENEEHEDAGGSHEQ